ncbi:hypothetical protein WH47_08320 [Habropoda laboriosa]|uniref:Uncharacterized protein n=1 Tax=Habropoda laboriosa TaxID=597456 RepID=A0A0L7RGV1_9HYME|nr:hypothetical protein WH47_08320 [Habropoda laboriosa]
MSNVLQRYSPLRGKQGYAPPSRDKFTSSGSKGSSANEETNRRESVDSLNIHCH